LSSHLRLSLSSGLLPSGFPIKSLYAPPSPPHVCYMPGLFHYSLFDHPYNIWWGLQSTELFVMWSSLLPCYLVPLGPKYAPQHPVLENPQHTFLPKCERPSFTPIQNNRQEYSSVYLNLYTFWY
jgi:hypothetical protein